MNRAANLTLRPCSFASLPGWGPNAARAIWPAFLSSARAQLAQTPQLRRARPPCADMIAFFQRALTVAPSESQEFLQTCAQPYLAASEGFLTGYYQPVVAGALSRRADFCAPIRARPSDLINFFETEDAPANFPFAGGRRDANGHIKPYFSRAEIEAGAIDRLSPPIVWLRDFVEVFLVQVQGSARVRLPDGSYCDLVYDGRNGRAYTSIGRALIEAGEIAPQDMSLARLKDWLRAHGQDIGQVGRRLMQTNQSYIFFRRCETQDASQGPIGGQGLALTAGQSIAIDRTIWPYGVLMWIAADLPALGLSAHQGRLWVAQDTGSAILGPARADLFIGSGDEAGRIAGDIRHPAAFYIFGPRGMQQACGHASRLPSAGPLL